MKKISFNNGFGKTGVCNPGKAYQNRTPWILINEALWYY